MYLAPKAVRRFSLLLLEESEDYLHEYICECTWPLEIVGNQSGKTTLTGTLRLCTKSIFFEPDDIRVAVVRIPFRLVEHLEPQPERRLVITTSGLTKMKEGNQDQPYLHIKGQESRWKFVLLYANFEKFLGVLTEQMAMKDNEDLYLKRSQQRVEDFVFDTSRLVDFSELIICEVPVIHLLPLVREQGKMVITNERLYFQPISCVNEAFDLVLTHPLHSIAAISRRRSALKPCGLEVFFMEDQGVNLGPVWGSPCAFFAFQRYEEREEVLELVLERMQPGSIPGGVLESEGEWLHRLTCAWQYGKISNFDYLLYLNLASGRTFSDLRQWPIFPWILSNYHSTVLDLQNPRNYRDLSKPIGALNSERLETFKRRYHEMPNGEGCPPPFYYGTHYSTPGYVMFWLVRAAPAHMLQLQSGKFDSPDRMFYSIPEAWTSVNHNPADVKELIPEFFLPNTDFLVNKGQLALGKRQNGKTINDVELPPWAKDPYDFLAKNRAALESEYVSQTLHLWINLVFGFQQRGQAAVEAHNVFYYLSYEGAVDIESVKDPLERKGLEAQINEFGQTPKQLFKHPHVPRLVIPPTPDPADSFQSSQTMQETNIEDGLKPSVGNRTASNQALSLALISIAQNVISFDGQYPTISSPPPLPPVLETPPEAEDPVKELSISTYNSLAGSQVDLYEKVKKDWSILEQFSPTMKKYPSAGDIKKSVSNTMKGFNNKFNSLVDSFNSKLMLTARPVVSPTASDPWFHTIPHKLKLRQGINFLQGAVKAVEISKMDGGTLYCAGDNATLKMFSLDHGQQLRSARIERNTGSGIPLSDLDLLPHSKPNFQPLALIGSYDNAVYVYSIEFGRLIGFFNAHEDAVSIVKLINRGKRSTRLMTASWDCSLKIWRLAEGRTPWEGLSSQSPVPEIHYPDHESEILQAAEWIEGGIMATGTEAGFLSLFDIRSSTPIWKIKRSETPITGLAFLQDGEHLISTSGDGSLQLLSLKKKEEALISVQSASSLRGCMTDGLMSLHGMENGQISVWNVGQYLGKASTTPEQPIPDPSGFFPALQCTSKSTVNSITVKPVTTFDGSEVLWVVAGHEDGTISIFSSL